MGRFLILLESIPRSYDSLLSRFSSTCLCLSLRPQHPHPPTHPTSLSRKRSKTSELQTHLAFFKRIQLKDNLRSRWGDQVSIPALPWTWFLNIETPVVFIWTSCFWCLEGMWHIKCVNTASIVSKQADWSLDNWHVTFSINSADRYVN